MQQKIRMKRLAEIKKVVEKEKNKKKKQQQQKVKKKKKNATTPKETQQKQRQATVVPVVVTKMEKNVAPQQVIERTQLQPVFSIKSPTQANGSRFANRVMKKKVRETIDIPSVASVPINTKMKRSKIHNGNSFLPKSPLLLPPKNDPTLSI